MRSIADRLTIDPEICNGKPTIRGRRIRLQTVVEHLGAGDSPEAVLAAVDFLEMEDIRACLRYAAELAERDALKRQSN